MSAGTQTVHSSVVHMAVAGHRTRFACYSPHVLALQHCDVYCAVRLIGTGSLGQQAYAGEKPSEAFLQARTNLRARAKPRIQRDLLLS